MQRILIPTGYMGSGSSAITDLLGEFDGIDGSHRDFEFIFMHCPDGLFDLEDKLLVGNNAIRSDEALRAFRKTMMSLYNKPLWWPGNYKHNFHPNFMEITNSFIKQLIQFQSDNYWYYQEKSGIPAFPQLAFNKLVRIATRGGVRLSKPLKYKGMEISLVTKDEFYTAARRYLNELFSVLTQSPTVVLDQLLLPFNLWRMENYFPDNAECFVVERDPRDIFALNKYVWGPLHNTQVPYPTEVETFCDYYRRLRQSERYTDNPHVHRFHFEDLIYKYDDSLNRIMDILSLSEMQHMNKRKLFNPDKSINNTQFFDSISNQEEIRYIEHALPEYLYEFPYKNVSNIKDTF